MDDEVEKRFQIIERKIAYLSSFLHVGLVEEELGGVEIEREELPFEEGVTEGDLAYQIVTGYKDEEVQQRGFDAQVASCSDRAKTAKPLPLSRHFRPSKVGFTAEAFKAMFPDVSPNESLEKFLSFYIARGDVAVNWFEKFLSWSAEAQRRAALAKKEHRVETDSMGLPLDPKLRRRMNGSPEDPDAAQRQAELKTRQDEIYESLTDEEKEMLK